MIPNLSSRQLDDLLQNKHASTIDTDGASLLFQLLRQEDLYMNMVWRSIWRASESTPSPTPC